jgi:hypothetical protein
MSTPMIILCVLIAFLIWFTVLIYSKRTFPLIGCKSCGATGKIFEPLWMAWLCGRRRRAFRLCTACSGGGKTQRRRHFM